MRRGDEDMARINIEECWWSDPRRTTLLLQIGFEADAAAVNMWRTAQEFWGKRKAFIPKEVFDKLKHASALLDAGLADVRESFVYVRGSSEYLSWLEEKREQAREAGKKSAEIRREKSGTAQPKGGKGRKKTERQPNDNRTEVNGSEPSGSGSYSGSISDLGSGVISENEKVAALAGAPSAVPIGRELVGHYCEQYKKRYGVNPVVRPQDAKTLKTIGESLGGNRVKTLLTAYLSMTTQWFLTKSHDVVTFNGSLNQIQKFAETGELVTFADAKNAEASTSLENQLRRLGGEAKR